METVGYLKRVDGKRCEVRWDRVSKEIYVKVPWGGTSFAGKAETRVDAMEKAEVWLRYPPR